MIVLLRVLICQWVLPPVPDAIGGLFAEWGEGCALISRFKETYPWLIREDGAFAFAALHYLVHVMVHVEEAAIPLDESGTVAFVRLVKPPGITDHLNP